MRYQLLFFLPAFGYLCNGESMTPFPQPLVPRDATTDCQNLKQGLNASCWNLVPQNIGMEDWLSHWNKTTDTCRPGELWANCFMRLTGLPSSASKPIRCDVIGYDVCPTPTLDLFQGLTAPKGYGLASIWGLQRYMTSLSDALREDLALSIVRDSFFNQTVPRTVGPILKDLLQKITDPIAGNLSLLIVPNTPEIIGQRSWAIPTEDLAPGIVRQTIAYLLQWMMKEFTTGAFTALNAEGSLIKLLVKDGW